MLAHSLHACTDQVAALHQGPSQVIQIPQGVHTLYGTRCLTACCHAGLEGHVAQHWPSLRQNPVAAALLAQPAATPTSQQAPDGGSSNSFPVDFFESCSIITQTVHLSGDVGHIGRFPLWQGSRTCDHHPVCACVLVVSYAGVVKHA